MFNAYNWFEKSFNKLGKYEMILDLFKVQSGRAVLIQTQLVSHYNSDNITNKTDKNILI